MVYIYVFKYFINYYYIYFILTSPPTTFTHTTLQSLDRKSQDEESEKVVMKEPSPLSAKVEKKNTKGAGGSYKPL